MANPNIDERQAEVFGLLKIGVILPSERKKLAEKYGCSLGAIHADIVTYNRIDDKCMYPNTKIKKVVYERDGYLCQYCGKKTENPIAEHVIPASIGGNGKPYNIVCACGSCNSKKKGGKVWIPKNIETLRKLNSEWVDKIEILAVADFSNTEDGI